MKTITFWLVLIFGASYVSAQTATPLSTLAWSEDAPDLATAQSYVYRHYDDGAATGAVFVGVQCGGNVSPFTCMVSFPAFTPGNHSLAVTAGNGVVESVKSTVLTFTFAIVPAVPTNVRIKE